MVLLFFALDLRTLSPPLLSQVKQCLLELANLYALSSHSLNLKRRNFEPSLEDRIGLCYLQQRSDASSSTELKVAYSPRGRGFNLHDFHYAANHLPPDSYMPPFLEDSGSFLLQDVEISCVFNDEVLCSAGGKEIEKKIILISSCLGTLDSNAIKTLLDAADRCISVEFVFLEQKSSQLSDISESINKFRGQISDLENCSFNAYLPDGQLFNGLAKRWLRELKENSEELFAHFLFQRSISGSVSRICCRLCNSVNQIMERFSPCETRGIQRDNRDDYMFKECLLNHVKRPEEPVNTDSNSTSVCENGLLAEASWLCWKNLGQVPSAVIFNVIERTSLTSLSEGVVVGRSYFVIPSVAQETDTALEESDLCQLNNRREYTSNCIASCYAIYCRCEKGLCRALNSMNQGLICWSYSNLEIMRETAFIYYYILQPSDSGLMLLRRLAGAEEFLPFPDTDMNDPSTEETDCCIKQFLLDVELTDYNPVLHCGGFHQKLNQFLEQSLHLGPVDPEKSVKPSDSFSIDDVSVSSQTCTVNNVAAPQVNDDVVSSARDSAADTKQASSLDQAGKHDQGITHLTEEWEQLIIGGIPGMDSVLSEPKLKKGRTSPLAVSHRPLDTRTSRILERLGNPEQVKTKANLPMTMSSFAKNPNKTTGNLPTDINPTDQASSSLMKPTFQRLKRKLR